MGICTSCFKGTFEPGKVTTQMSGSSVDPETQRQRQAEAAERRLQEQERRGIKNVESVRKMQLKSEKQAEMGTYTSSQESGLKWSVD